MALDQQAMAKEHPVLQRLFESYGGAFHDEGEKARVVSWAESGKFDEIGAFVRDEIALDSAQTTHFVAMCQMEAKRANKVRVAVKQPKDRSLW